MAHESGTGEWHRNGAKGAAHEAAHKGRIVEKLSSIDDAHPDRNLTLTLTSIDDAHPAASTPSEPASPGFAGSEPCIGTAHRRAAMKGGRRGGSRGAMPAVWKLQRGMGQGQGQGQGQGLQGVDKHVHRMHWAAHTKRPSYPLP